MISIMKSFFNREIAKYKFSQNTNSQLTTTNAELCRKCKGACCKNCGCHFSPYDFEDLTFEGLKKEMDVGYISIDIIVKKQSGLDQDYLILRIRNKDRNIHDTHYISSKLGCSLLTKDGCLLTYAERPRGGKLLIPSWFSSCEAKYNITTCSLEWSSFQDILGQLLEYYQAKEANQYYENQLVKKGKIS